MAEARRASVALAMAAERNDLEGVRRALEATDDPSRPCGPMRITALQLAADHGDAALPVLHELLGRGARAAAPDKLGRTPLHHAAAAGGAAAVRALLAAGADPDARFRVDTLRAKAPGAPAPSVCDWRGSADSLDVVAGDGLPLPECWERTPLHLAAKGNFPEVVSLLLSAGASVDAEDERGLSPLLLAGAGLSTADSGLAPAHGSGQLQRYERVVALLTGAGADARRRHPDTGASALHHAAQLRSTAAAAALLKAGAEAGGAAAGGGGATPLHEAAGAGALAVVRLLIDSAGDAIVNMPDQGGRTALHKAAFAGSRAVVTLLLAHGGDLAARTASGATALEALLEGIPRPAVFLSSLLDSCVRANGSSVNDRDFKIYVDLGPLCPHGPLAQMQVTRAFMEAMPPRPLGLLFQHPLLQLFVHLKWRRLLALFLLFTAVHVAFVLSLSYYAYELVSHGPPLKLKCAPAWYPLVGTACMVLLYLAGQIILLPRHYVKEAESWLHLICVLLALSAAVLPLCSWYDDVLNNIYCVDFETKEVMNYSLRGDCCKRSCLSTKNMSVELNSTDTMKEVPLENRPLPLEAELHLLSVAVLLGWAEVMFLLGRFPTIGYYALMFQTVLKNVLKVILSFSCLVVGYAISYEVQYSRAPEFSSPWKAIVRTAVMMTGEFQYTDLYKNDSHTDTDPKQPTGMRLFVTSRIIFLTFIILAPIVLMNLMMGLAVSDIQALQEEGLVRMTLKQADFVAHLEALTGRLRRARALRGFQRCLLNRAVATCLTLQPLFPSAGAPRIPGALLEALAALALRNRERERRRRRRAQAQAAFHAAVATAHSPAGGSTHSAQRPLGAAASLPPARRHDSPSESSSSSSSDECAPCGGGGGGGGASSGGRALAAGAGVRVRLEVEDTSAGEMSPPPPPAPPTRSASPLSGGSPRSSRRPSELTLSASPAPALAHAAAAASVSAHAHRELARQVRRLRREVALLRAGSHGDGSPVQAELLTAAAASASRRRSLDMGPHAPPSFRRTYRRTLRHHLFNWPRGPSPAPAPATATASSLAPPAAAGPLSPPPRPAPPQRGASTFSLMAASVRDSALGPLRRLMPPVASDMELLDRPADQR